MPASSEPNMAFHSWRRHALLASHPLDAGQQRFSRLRAYRALVFWTGASRGTYCITHARKKVQNSSICPAYQPIFGPFSALSALSHECLSVHFALSGRPRQACAGSEGPVAWLGTYVRRKAHQTSTRRPCWPLRPLRMRFCELASRPIPQPTGGAARARTTGPGDVQVGSGWPRCGSLDVWGYVRGNGATIFAC